MSPIMVKNECERSYSKRINVFELIELLSNLFPHKILPNCVIYVHYKKFCFVGRLDVKIMNENISLVH